MKNVFKISLLGLFLCLSFVPAAQISSRLKTLDSALTQLHTQALFNGVALFAEKGKILYQKNFGIANLETNSPLTISSSFNLASVTKQFVTMMVMMLKEQDKLNYDDPIQKYLPPFPYEKITLRHLMTHTSGLPEYFELVQRYSGPLDTLTNESLLRLLSERKPALVFLPGERYTYCNTGYALLASVIERVSGITFDKFFQQRIVTPLGLKNTCAYNLFLKTLPTNRVFGFRRDNGKNPSYDLMRLDGIWGDGNIYSSAEDLLQWDQALYNEKLVKQKTLMEAFTPVTLNDGSTYPYGFGWRIENAGKKVQHTGSWLGFRNLISRDLEKRYTLIVLSNGDNGLARTVAEEIIGGKKPHLPESQLITNVTLIDGTGTPTRKASVRLSDDKIREVGDLLPFPNEKVVDGGGQTLAPGFIDSHSHHDWYIDQQPDAIAATNQGITTIVVGQDGGGTPIDTLTAMLLKQPVAVNMATYSGHTTLRLRAMGTGGLLRTSRPPELEKMKELLKLEMDKGSLGLATGLEYENAFYSNRLEVVELAKVAAANGGRYISHIRSEDVNLEDALDEIIAIGREAKLPVQISHVKIAMKSKWGKSRDILSYLQEARASGIHITADCYPYDYWMSTLRVLFPKRDYQNPQSAQFAVRELFDPDKSVLVAFAPHPEYAGKSVGEVAALSNEKTPVTLMRLIDEASKYKEKNAKERGNTEGIMAKSMSEEDIVNFLAWPHTNICSDGAVLGHPRGHGAFARVLGKYVREMKIMSLENAVYKMTGLTAEHLGITDRGIIAPGYYADLVLFNPQTVKDNASIENPKALSTGIDVVWVNGKVVYQNQKATGVYPGQFLKRK